MASSAEKTMVPVRFSRVPSPKSLTTPGSKISKWQHKVDRFLRRIKEQSFGLPTEYEDLVFLYRIYNRNASIIPAFASSILDYGVKPKLMDPTARLSLAKYKLTPREAGRLQRAICQYVIHCALLDPRATHAGVDLKDANLSLPRHEAEELMHIRTFVRDQYYLVFGELEDNFSKYLLKHMRKDTSQPEVQRYPAGKLVAETWETFPYLEHFTKHYDKETGEQIRPQSTSNYVSFLVDLGPDFLRHFLRVPTARRTAFILETMYPVLSLRRQIVGMRDDTAPTNSKDPSRAPNAAWKIMPPKRKSGTGGTSTGTWPSQRESLRRYGWVFWDGFRLREMGLDSHRNILDAAKAERTVMYKAGRAAGRAADIPGLVEARFRRLFWARNVKREWAANACE